MSAHLDHFGLSVEPAAPHRLQQPGRTRSGDGKSSAQFLTEIVE